MDYRPYIYAVTSVLHSTDATRRTYLLQRQKLPGGVPFAPVGNPVAGPQCVTLTLRIDNQDLKSVLALADRFAMAAGSQFARVYRNLDLVRIEFTLPRSQWQEVRLANLLHRPQSAAIGQQALGPVARLDWTVPHKAVFGTTRSGKTTCMVDLITSLVKSHAPDECRFLIANPKNDPALRLFGRLAHLAGPVASNYEDSATLLRYALGEMERRQQDERRCDQRWVIVIDEIAELTMVKPEVGPMITRLSQMAGGLNLNLVVASQAANPSVFGKSGSLAKTNFGSRIVFQLPREQAYLATGIDGQETDKLGGRGDGLVVSNGMVTRFRSAKPGKADIAALPRLEQEPPPIPADQLAGDREAWQIDPDRLAYALVVNGSASAIRNQFGGGTSKAMEVRDYAGILKGRIRHWRKYHAQEIAA